MDPTVTGARVVRARLRRASAMIAGWWALYLSGSYPVEPVGLVLQANSTIVRMCDLNRLLPDQPTAAHRICIQARAAEPHPSAQHNIKLCRSALQVLAHSRPA